MCNNDTVKSSVTESFNILEVKNTTMTETAGVVRAGDVHTH